MSVLLSGLFDLSHQFVNLLDDLFVYHFIDLLDDFFVYHFIELLDYLVIIVLNFVFNFFDFVENLIDLIEHVLELLYLLHLDGVAV